MPVQDAAKVLRVELKEMFPDASSSVRIDQYSGGESIDVRWVDGPSSESVEALLPKYKRDNWRYVHGSHHFTPEAWNSVLDALKKEYPGWNDAKYEDHEKFWPRLSATIFPPKPVNTSPTM